MALVTIFTLVAAGLIVAALAGYLIAILFLLRKTVASVKSVTDDLATIAESVAPLEPALTDINNALLESREVLGKVVEDLDADGENAGPQPSEGSDDNGGGPPDNHDKPGSPVSRLIDRARGRVRDAR